MAYTKVSFKNKRGEGIGARLDLPEGEPKAYALFAHCFTCNKNLAAVRKISQALNKNGVAVLCFDFTGLGESEGDFADTNFSTNVDDLIQAAEFLNKTYAPPQMIIGHSLGGAAVLQAAGRLPSVKAVATIGAPCNPGHVTHLLQSALEKIESDGEAEILLAGRPFKIKKQFLDDLAEQKMNEVIHNLKRPLLVCHSPVDNTVGIENAAHIFTNAFHPKSFLSLDNADHLLMNSIDARYVGQMIANWSSRYIN
ncbi:MAG: alpha/beta fold hydrolase [Chloroflexota bacterium]